ncbi:MAG: hypothetical protein ABI903_10690 [Actinomycetota bacterium]
MITQRTGVEIALATLVAVALLLAIGRALKAAEQRGWIRLHGVSKGSAAVAFAAMEDMFSGSRSQARQLLEEQRRVGHRAPTPGDWLNDGPSVAGRFAGKLTVSVNASQTADVRHIIASRY